MLSEPCSVEGICLSQSPVCGWAFLRPNARLGAVKGVDAKGSLPHGPPSVKLIRLGICRGLDKWGARQVRQT